MQPAIQPRSPTRTRCLLQWLAVALPLALPIAYLAVGGIAANALTVPKRQYDAQNTPARLNLWFEDIRFPSRGGEVQLAG